MAEDSSQPPPITISRTSTESRASSKKSRKQAKSERKQSPRLDTRQIRGFQGSRRQKGDSWKQRHHSPDIGWHIKWVKGCFPNGRVIIIDYISNEAVHSPELPSGKRHIAVASQEVQHIEGLQAFYADQARAHSAALRVIHVQNATWATRYLLKKFNIDHSSEVVGMQDFSKWCRFERPRQRNGMPFPNGKAFREQTDPWRNVSRTAFGLDYLKVYDTPSPEARRHSQARFGDKPIDARMMHLNAYEDSRNSHGYDVSVQRLSVYVQRNLGPPGRVSPDEEVKNPYIKHNMNGLFGAKDRDDGSLDLESLDNTNTVIVFETSASMMLEDCLIQPRNDFERRWRRLSFYLRKEEALNDSRLAAQCTNMILSDVFHSLAVIWEEFLNVATDHVNILEDKIYEYPADESRAPELWTNQAAWLKVDKIMWIHQDLVKEMQGHMRELADTEEDESPIPPPEWMASTPAEYEKLGHSIQEDLVQPTSNLSDLMYKSVGIRDSRQSLQLGLSMWRLSWITFIFLPLTFIVGFFGMNVTTFQNSPGYPNIGWYFLAAVLLMTLVLLLWYCVKHSLQRRRQTPYQRGLYEHLFNELEDEYPTLWSATDGAVEDVEPTGVVNKLKWRLLKRWFDPEKTINKKLYSSLAPDGGDDELGASQRFQRYLLIKWLPQIRAAQVGLSEDVELGATRHSWHNDRETINELAKMGTAAVMADAEPTAVQGISTYGLQPLFPRVRGAGSPSPRHSDDRPSSRGSSGIMIEERNLSDSDSDVGEGAEHHEEAASNSGEERGRQSAR